MRNLKRALSLTLASVMLLGMMVIGTSAASYPDVTDDHNVEAIEVLQAVGAMSGSNSGNFNPDAKISRIEMAIVMSNLLGLEADYFEGQNSFSDVPDWAAKYVSACEASGIVSGVGGGRFGTGNVTATQAALMMMKALGYFQYASDFGTDWARATANQAAKIRLFDGISVSNNTQLTRNQVAQLALNAIESGMVDADNSGTINVTTPDGTVVSNGSVNYVYRSSQQSFAKAIDTTEKNFNTSALTGVTGSVIELGEQLYNGDLKRYETTDNFGAPSTRWTYKNSEVGNYANGADYEFEGEVKSNAMYSAVGKTAAEDYQWIVLMDGRDEDADGKDLFVRKDVADNDKDTLAGTKRGATTYVYLDDTAVRSGGVNYSGTATVCIVNTYAAEVTKVDGDTITLDDMDDAGLEYDVVGYAEEDVVLYTKSIASNGDWTVESIIGKAELVEGEADTIREKDRVVIGDKTYRYSYRFFDGESKMLGVDSVDENVAFYLDTQDNIIMLADAAESNDYAYVYSVGNASSKYGDDADFGAKLILTDGSTRNVDIDKDDTDDWKKSGFDSDDQLDALRYGATKSGGTWTAKTTEGDAVSVTNTDADKQVPLVGQIVAYSEDNGVYSLEIKTSHASSWSGITSDILKNGNSRVKLNPSGTIYTDKNSAILLNDDPADLDDYSAYVGYENAPTVDVANGSKLVAYVKDGVVKAMYINKATIKGNSSVIFVIGANSPKENGTGSNKYYVYDAVVDGEIKSIRVKSNSDAATDLDKVKKGQLGVFFGMTENSSGYVTKLTTTVPSDYEVNGNASNSNNNKWNAYEGVSRETTDGLLGFNWDATNKEYTVRPAANKDATIAYYDGSDLSVESLHTDRNDKAWVVTDDGKVIAVFVWEQKDGEGSGGNDDEEEPAYGLALKGDTLTFTYTVGDTSGIRSAIKSLLESEGYTNVKITTASGKITKVTAEDNGDEIEFTLKKTEISAAPEGDTDLPADLNAFKGFTSYPTQSFDGEEMTLSMSGEVTPLVKATDGDAKTKQEAALQAFANEANKEFDDFEALYDLANGTWGFVTVTIGDTDYILLVGVQKDSPKHEWEDYEREGRIVAGDGEMGIVVHASSGDDNGKVVFLKQWTTPEGIKVNVKDLTVPS